MIAAAHDLHDLKIVSQFHTDLLRDVLGHALPAPVEVTEETARARSVEVFEQWLNLLDLAITPPMLRGALAILPSRNTVEALLRYYVRKGSLSESDRDKTDLAATSLYRILISPEELESDQDTSPQCASFESALKGILDSEGTAALPPEHQGLLREFSFIRREVEDFRYFDDLMDSGVIDRVRNTKARLGASFYSSSALAAVADHNVFFGGCFDRLFYQAAQQIKQFAIAIQEQGASTLSKLEEGVTVQHLTEIEGPDLLRTDYTRAREEFRKVSRLKKVVDRNAQVRSRAASTASRAAATPAPGIGGLANAMVEESKLNAAVEQVYRFVEASDAKEYCMVPLQSGTITLAAGEIEAFRADFMDEKSFRRDYAHSLREMIAIQARLCAEMQEYQAKKPSSYLWKPHLVSLAWLLHRAQKLQQNCAELSATAHKRGLSAKAGAINASLQKLQVQVQLAAKTLESVHEKPDQPTRVSEL